MKPGLSWIAILIAISAAGCDVVAPPPTPTLPAAVAEGRVVFEKICSACHSTTPDMIVVGPSLAGVATRAGSRIEGMDAEAYIRDSIMNPEAYTVEGFREGLMPPAVYESLTPQEFEAVVAYLLTLD